MDKTEYTSSDQDILRQLRHAIRELFTGTIVFDRYSVLFDKGTLCSVYNTEDRFWFLRRLFCGRFIDEEYAQTLQQTDKDLELILFPQLPKDLWQKMRVERAQQNLFELLFLHVKGERKAQILNEPPLLEGLDLDEFVVWRERLYIFRSRLSRIWLKPKNSVSLGDMNSISLSELLAQSPSEEFETLKSLYELIQKGELDWGENIAALNGELTEDEEGLFADHDPTKIKENFVIAKEHLDRFYLGSEGEQKVKGMLLSAGDLLVVYASAFGKSLGIFFSKVQHSADPDRILDLTQKGRLALKRPLLAPDCFVLLDRILVQALSEPNLKSNEEEFRRALEEWRAKWSG
ncbi:MAG: hypothetical protein VX278_02805 [Myxococcota bacterium]|nr:hypothetical protein [Myxococcota bacterium]